MNTFLNYRLLEEVPDEGGGEGMVSGEGGAAEAGPPSGSDAPPSPSPFLRDISEDDAYEALRTGKNVPNLLQALESRVTHQLPPLEGRLGALEQALGQRVAFNPELKRSLAALQQYDPSGELGKSFLPALIEDLKESLQINQLDKAAIDPFVQPQLQQYNDYMWEQMVGTMIGDSVAEAIPDTVDGKFAPTNTRQKDFVEWYAQQDAPTQKALHAFSPAYIRAFKAFERWEGTRIKEREKAVGASSARLQGSQTASSGGRRSVPNGPMTDDEAFNAGFEQVMKELRGA